MAQAGYFSPTAAGNLCYDNSMKTNENRYEYLTQTPVPKLISRLAVPTILSMLVTGIYNAADTFFVGRISTQATAAVGLVFSVMALIQAVGFFCGQGSGSYLSRLLGAGKIPEGRIGERKPYRDRHRPGRRRDPFLRFPGLRGGKQIPEQNHFRRLEYGWALGPGQL